MEGRLLLVRGIEEGLDLVNERIASEQLDRILCEVVAICDQVERAINNQSVVGLRLASSEDPISGLKLAMGEQFIVRANLDPVTGNERATLIS
ncbi:hypothetical protein WMF26_00730 [Sorangium sp. So ce185]|uniref:hypothetical protein n=1 Tax=Sorangium sp. So ce185 TaxID=3133287 RepID=UPI003F615D15